MISTQSNQKFVAGLHTSLCTLVNTGISSHDLFDLVTLVLENSNRSSVLLIVFVCVNIDKPVAVQGVISQS